MSFIRQKRTNDHSNVGPQDLRDIGFLCFLLYLCLVAVLCAFHFLKFLLSAIRTIDEIFFLPERRQRERQKRERESRERWQREWERGRVKVYKYQHWPYLGVQGPFRWVEKTHDS